jgi:adenylate cyclase
VSDARLGVLLYDFEDSYLRVLYLFWLTDPAVNLPRQFALLVAVWTHGCIGLYMWLRLRPWYKQWSWAFGAAALALPLLAVLGVTNAGWDTRLHAAVEPGFSALHGAPAAGTPRSAAGAALEVLVLRLELGYVALVAAILVLRVLRSAYERRRGGFRIDYSVGRSVTVPRGFSILEASRWARIPHASVCGGRGRCSTCRVRVSRGLEGLAAPAAVELVTLQRIHATAGVRLACQVRPTADVSVTPLVAAGRPFDGLRVELDQGRELLITALYVDLRDSTRLAAGRLPFDAIFIVDRYIQATTGAILAQRGHVTSVAGDGIMSVFGVDGDGASGARRALSAAEAVWQAVDAVSADLTSEIASPLRFGIGVHTGPAVVGPIGLPDRTSLQFLGDTGNLAARLESLTKEMTCTMIVSAETLAAAERQPSDWRAAEVDIRGRDATVPVFLIDRRDQLQGTKTG